MPMLSKSAKVVQQSFYCMRGILWYAYVQQISPQKTLPFLDRQNNFFFGFNNFFQKILRIGRLF